MTLPGATMTSHIPTESDGAGTPPGGTDGFDAADEVTAGGSMAQVSAQEAPGPIVERHERSTIDLPRAEAAVRELLYAIGEDPDRDGLRETPARVARSYQEVFGGLAMSAQDALTITFDVHHDELIVVKDIEVYSTCEHHLVPFHGVAHVGYIPNKDGRVTGLSKLARLVEMYGRRLQVQERLTSQIAEAVVEHLGAQGVIVVVEAEHSCMTMRGVRKPGASTVTSAVRGQLRDPATRAEAMSLINGR